MAFETRLILGSDYNSYPCAKECTMTLMASLECPHTTNHIANLDLCCVLDKSGSMAGSRLNLMKDAVKFLVGQLRADDRLTIVLFSCTVDTVLTMRPMDEEGKAIALNVINQITAGGQTNLSGALTEGLTIVQQHGDHDNVSSMMLFTDGQATVGLRSAAKILQEMNSLLPKMPSCCSVYTFGFGIEHDSDLLYQMSKAGQGTYCYISKNEEIAAAFGDCSGGLLSVAAKNVKAVFQISDPNNCSLVNAELCSFYPTETNSNEYRIGDVFCDECKDLLFSVKIPKVSEERVYDLASITLTYFDLNTLNTVTETQTWKITRNDNHEVFGNNWTRILGQNNRLSVINGLKNCILAIKEGNFEKAIPALEITSREISGSVTRDQYALSVNDDIKNIIEKANDREAFVPGGGLHTLFNMLSSHSAQRCTATAYAEGQHQNAQREFNTPAKLVSMTQCISSMRPHYVVPVQPTNWFLRNAYHQQPQVPVDPNQTVVCQPVGTVFATAPQ